MNDAAPNAEPSMEEILASIRRIISEDDDPNSEAPPPAAAAAPAEPAKSEPEPLPELPPIPEVAAEPDPIPEPEPIPEPDPVPEPESIPEPAAAPEPPMELPELPELPPPEPPPMVAMAPLPETAPSDSDHVLNLTQEILADGSVVDIATGRALNGTGAPAEPAEPAAPPELELRDDPLVSAADKPSLARSLFGRKGKESETNSGESPLISTVTEEVTVEALASVRPPEESNFMPPESPSPTGIGAQTIEQLVRDAVRPLIKEWLDANLPSMVERLVAREIERIGRRANR